MRARAISALGEGDKQSLDWGTGFTDDGSLQPFGGPLWAKFSAEVEYQDGRLAHAHRATYEALPTGDEDGPDAFPWTVDFQLEDIQVNRVVT